MKNNILDVVNRVGGYYLELNIVIMLRRLIVLKEKTLALKGSKNITKVLYGVKYYFRAILAYTCLKAIFIVILRSF